MYGNKDKSLCMVNDTKMTSISQILENQETCKNRKIQKKLSCTAVGDTFK